MLNSIGHLGTIFFPTFEVSLKFHFLKFLEKSHLNFGQLFNRSKSLIKLSKRFQDKKTPFIDLPNVLLPIPCIPKLAYKEKHCRVSQLQG